MLQVSKSLMAAALTIGFLAVGVAPVVAHGEETAKESAQESGRTIKAKSKKGMNKVKEAVCTEGDAKCAAKKVGHRVDEAGDSVSNKAKELNDKAD